ncbi:MAG: TGS domain-containing protein, partial [Mesosutterella sp.]|nr:TGS domain-containing protein [Mesosutterella sp.]
MIEITLPDGSKRQYEGAQTVAQIAASIGAGLARAAIAGRVDGQLVDLSTPVDHSAAVSIVTASDEDGLQIIRHSTAHLMAQAVKQLYPSVQVTIGPAIENGFYYDFSSKKPFTQEDLAAIEQRMDEIVKQDLPITRREVSREEAVKFFESEGEHYKVELVRAIPEGEKITLYTQGDFTDLCRGPHVPSTGCLKVHKLMKVAGAYWRGDSKNEMLQRIYGTAFATREQLKNYLHMLEEAGRRDHRKLGKTMDLFHLQEEAP